MFTPEETALNQEEGWDLFSYDMKYWAIERIDCPEDDDGEVLEPRFSCDIEAFHYCKQRAYEGSERHQRAINAHGNLV